VSDHPIEFNGEELLLLPERAAFWPAGRTLFVADLHLGKVATMRAAGAALPGGSTSADLRRLTTALRRTGASRLAILGDLFHARAGREAAPTRLAVARWREEWPSLEILHVRGNHDRHAGDPDPDLRVVSVPEPHRAPPFVLRHHPATDPAGAVLAGHLHPGASLRGSGGETVRLPCFWLQPRLAILPAFGSTTGLYAINPKADDRVLVVVDDEILSV
jgi:uncharacterized protein